MICEKCGANIPQGAKKCQSCSAPLPKNCDCRGFADILTYKLQPLQAMFRNEKNNESDGIDMKDLEELKKYVKFNTILSIASVGISFAVLVCSVVFGAVSCNKINEASVDTGNEIRSLEKKLTKANEASEKDISDIKDNIEVINTTIERFNDYEPEEAANKSKLEKTQNELKKLCGSLELFKSGKVEVLTEDLISIFNGIINSDDGFTLNIDGLFTEIKQPAVYSVSCDEVEIEKDACENGKMQKEITFKYKENETGKESELQGTLTITDDGIQKGRFAEWLESEDNAAVGEFSTDDVKYTFAGKLDFAPENNKYNISGTLTEIIEDVSAQDRY